MLLVGFALLSAASAGADPIPPAANAPDLGISSRIRPRWIDVHYDVRKTLAELAKCAVFADPEKSTEMLVHANEPMTPDDVSLVTPDCLVFATWGVDEGPVELQTNATVIQFSFADEVFRRELTQSDLHRLLTAPPLSQPQSDKAAYYRVGECIVRAAPERAKGLLLTKVETDAEAEAFVRLLPAISSCQPDGATLTPNKADIRGTVALNYVRLAAATDQLPSARAKSK